MCIELMMAYLSPCIKINIKSESEMGNKQEATHKQSKKYIMEVTNKTIILNQPLQMKLIIGQLEVFPHGLDGLKLWDAGIVLSRYLIKNCEIFQNKDVLQLGSGVGIGGITLRKWTQCNHIVMSDYHASIVENMRKNCQKNDIKVDESKKPIMDVKQKIDTILLDWRDTKQYEQKFDFIIGSDIVYFGCPVEDLYKLFKNHLKSGGQGIIVIPDRKNYAQLFSKLIQPAYFQLKVEDLTSEQYSQPVLQNTQQSKHKYSLLGNIKFYVYRLTRK